VPYTIEEVKRILAAAEPRRNSARWAVALALGLRQGEALGLRWSDIDLDAGTLAVRRARQRPRLRRQLRSNQRRILPTGEAIAGRRGRDQIPEWPPGHRAARRTGHPAPGTPRREGSGARGRGAAVAGRRLGIRHSHRSTAQPEHRLPRVEAAAALGRRPGRTATRRPSHRRDRPAHPRRARRVVLGLMGWSHGAIAGRYQHITEAIRRDVADRVGDLLWQPSDHDDRDDGDDGAAGVRVPA
jgi:integrase